MLDEVEELYDYDTLRSIEVPTMFQIRLGEPFAVLGSSQEATVLNADSSLARRRRRGGGGVVFLQPDDLWIDFWIPAADERWTSDLHDASLAVGRWWADALRQHVDGDFVVHEGSVTGDDELRSVCFAGRGPGEVFLAERKVVGLTQWRVREGTFLSTVLPGSSMTPLSQHLEHVPSGLESALNHHTWGGLGIDQPDEVLATLRTISGPWSARSLYLMP
jgi:lipoate-protein ligase A